jgi:2-keto-3-deoxy-L-rhamnonate aldolase RhmA
MNLSASMGMPGNFEHSDVIQAIEKIKTVGTAMKKPGIACS